MAVNMMMVDGVDGEEDNDGGGDDDIDDVSGGVDSDGDCDDVKENLRHNGVLVAMQLTHSRPALPRYLGSMSISSPSSSPSSWASSWAFSFIHCTTLNPGHPWVGGC